MREDLFNLELSRRQQLFKRDAEIYRERYPDSGKWDCISYLRHVYDMMYIEFSVAVDIINEVYTED